MTNAFGPGIKKEQQEPMTCNVKIHMIKSIDDEDPALNNQDPFVTIQYGAGEKYSTGYKDGAGK